jgi:hypothetical protein
MRIYAKLSRSFREEAIEHLQSRIELMNDDTRRFEEAFEDMVTGIRTKRELYFRDYEISPPDREQALENLNRFTQVDITHLRKVQKSTPAYEFFSYPMMILFNHQPLRKKKADGTIQVLNWPILFKSVF